jgi:response regulator RpfG family c-di-GMP phosphodiesterase
MKRTQSRSTQQISDSKRRILIVDDEPSIVKMLAEMLRQHDYSCLGCQSSQEALHLMDTHGFDIVLCDVHMPGMSGMDLLRVVREKYPRMATVMVTGEGDVRVGVQAMKEGADDYLLKPLNLDAVLVSLNQVMEREKLEAELENYRLHLEEMVEQRTGQLRRAKSWIELTYDETLQALAAALDLRDNDTAGHSRRVMEYTLRIAKGVGCSKLQLNNIARGALLHDIGKIGMPDAILMKPGPLTDKERSVMDTHVGVGYSFLNHIGFLAGAAEIVLTHHERFDGTGYPQGLCREEIPLGARIFAVADTLDAITSDRPYRPARTFAVAREEIIRESGKQFDPEVVSAFLAIDQGIWPELRNKKRVIRSLGIVRWEVVPPAQADHPLPSLEAGA